MLLKDWNSGIPFVLNFHITKECNMKCKFCFGGFSESFVKRTKEDWFYLIKKISKETSFIKNKRINFAGGEPLIIPYLSDLVKLAKEEGFETSIITNGSLLTESFLDSVKDYIDMIGISIDSTDDNVNNIIGRKTIKGVMSLQEYIDKCNWITNRGIKLKVNTVINKYNYSLSMSKLIENTSIDRWKILRMLKIDNENRKFHHICPSDQDFELFIRNHSKYKFVLENDDDITSTYIFISPSGDLMDNSTGNIKSVGSLFENTLSCLFEKIPFNYDSFKKRYE